jgi:hypothetical protein
MRTDPIIIHAHYGKPSDESGRSGDMDMLEVYPRPVGFRSTLMVPKVSVVITKEDFDSMVGRTIRENPGAEKHFGASGRFTTQFALCMIAQMRKSGMKHKAGELGSVRGLAVRRGSPDLYFDDYNGLMCSIYGHNPHSSGSCQWKG